MKKSIISPVLAVLYIVTAVTGVFLFFHIHGGLIKLLHQWLGIAFVITGILHLVLNWNIFTSYFKNRSKAAVIAITLIIFLSISLWSGFSQTRRYNKYGHRHYSESHGNSKTHHFSGHHKKF